MKIFYLASIMLLAQLSVCGALLAVTGWLAGEGRRHAWREASPPLGWASLFALIMALCLHGIFSLTAGEEVGTWLWYWVFDGGDWIYTACGAPTTSGCYLLLVAGNAESRGRLATARRLARLGGLLAAIGALAQLAPGLWRFGNLPQQIASDSGTRAAVLSLGLASAMVAGLVGLLAGLSGKPRPSGHACAAFVALSAVAWVLATSF